MPKLNTFAAAILGASMFALPAFAGGPGPTLAGGPVYETAPAPHAKTLRSKQSAGHVYSGAQAYASASANASAQSGTATASSSAYASAVNGTATASSSARAQSYPAPVQYGHDYSETMYMSAPAQVHTQQIVCMVHGNEVPCETVPGLADALNAQGMHDLASQLPPGAPHAGGQGGYYVGGDAYVPARQSSYYSAGYTQQSSSVNSGYGPYGTRAYGAPGTIYGAYTTTGGYPVFSPCGQFLGYAGGCQTPVTVRLDNTIFAYNGGVGEGVYGEFYGGGGTLISGGGSYSGVTNAAGFHYGNHMAWKSTWKGGGKGGHHGGGKGGGKGGHHGGKGGCGQTKCGGAAYPGKPGGGHSGKKGGYHGGGYGH